MNVPFNIYDFLERAALAYGDRIAIRDEPDIPGTLGNVTYRELKQKAEALATGLEEMGIRIGDRVAIVSPNAAKFLVALFGVSGFGRILVPINYRLNRDEIQYIVEHSGSAVVLIDPELGDQLAELTAMHRILLDGKNDKHLFHRDTGSVSRVEQDENSLVSVNYTSGTTARPKGVRLTHRNCWMNAMALGWHIGISDRDVYLHTLPTFHCNGWGIPYALTAMGCEQIIVRKIDGEVILDRIEEYGVTLLCGAPTVVAIILAAAKARQSSGMPVPGFGRVRMVVAGAPPPSSVIEQVETVLGWEFIQLYGLTETSPLVTFNRAPKEWDGLSSSERARWLGRAGVPGIGVQLAVDADGEVLTRSNYVFDGYWQQPNATAEAIQDGWFHTGDAGALDDAFLSIVDRKKDVIITGGENVSSIEVEDCLYSHPGVSEACVIGVPHQKWGETIKALIVPEVGMSPTAEELIAYCRERLAHFKCPTSVDFVDELERTATGKLQKYRIRKRYLSE